MTKDLIGLTLLGVVLFSLPVLGGLFARIRQARKTSLVKPPKDADRARAVGGEA
jgi:hypothetical protein